MRSKPRPDGRIFRERKTETVTSVLPSRNVLLLNSFRAGLTEDEERRRTEAEPFARVADTARAGETERKHTAHLAMSEISARKLWWAIPDSN